MKVILLVGTYPQYSETFIIRKAISLIDRGCEVLIMARRKGHLPLLESFDKNSLPKVEYLPGDKMPTSPREFLDSLVSLFYSLISSPFGFFELALDLSRIGKFRLKYIMRYLPFINKKHYQIIHAEFFGLGMYYNDLKEIVDLPYVVSGRGTDINLLPIKENIESEIQFCKGIDKLHVVSEDLKRQLLDQSLIDPSRIVVNRPAVTSLENFGHKASASSTIPVVLSVGRLVWIKGYDYLLQAYRILKEEGILFNAQIVGDGPLYNELYFSIRDLGLEGTVTLCGPMPSHEVEKKMAEADIYVLASHAEGINNGVLEAMRMGVPVVSTSIGGMREVIENSRSGILVPPRDPIAMSAGIRDLINSSELRARLAKEGKQVVRQKFALENQAELFYETYKSVLN